MIVIREYGLNVGGERSQVALVKNSLHQLPPTRNSFNQSPDYGIRLVLTNFFRSSLRTSGLTPMMFRSILLIVSSLNITISWLKNLIRHGLVPMWTLGILDFSRETREDNMGRRGRIELSVTSRGPGTKTK
jgi:hypothetical protein